MIRYEVIRPPIYIDVFEVKEVGEAKAIPGTLGANYRWCTVENHGVRPIYEKKDSPVKVGDYVGYDVSLDDFTVFDPKSAAPGVTLIPTESTAYIFPPYSITRM